MKYIFVLIIPLWLIGCATKEKPKDIVPPSVTTQIVIDTLENTKAELKEAGLSNSKVTLSIDRALTLAERLDLLLQQIEKEQQRLDNKIVKEPIKL
jgi:hypothetical protein